MARGGVPDHIAANVELSRHSRRLIATDVALIHRGLALRSLDAPITVIRGRDDNLVDDAACEGWASVSTAAVHTMSVPGGHFFYRAAPERLVAVLRMELSSLDGAYELP